MDDLRSEQPGSEWKNGMGNESISLCGAFKMMGAMFTEVGGMVSTDDQQRSAPLRHGVNAAVNHELGYSVPLFQKSSFQFLERFGGWLAASNSSP
ncbi:hypothetical protein TNCV_4617921 [Trichonephila clavipes]|nr:hypothetical protein TNCV_4617921 [Trichonephila clavipes]